MRSSRVTPAYLYGLETMAMTEKTKQNEVCGINWVRSVVGVKRVDKRRMEELREEVGVRESLGGSGCERESGRKWV